MIFVCVGSREYQFDRLLKEIDKLIDKNIIKDKVFAQIGQSTYIPKKYKYTRFLPNKEFQCYQDKADLIISHGGTGALIGALKKNKQVIAVPRLAKYGEHTDNHQVQISTVLHDEEYLKMVTEINTMGKSIIELQQKPILKKYNRPSNILKIVNDFIETI